MDYSKMKKAQLIEEMEALQEKVAELARAETERKRAEEALRDSRHMLQTVLDSIPAAVFWKDRDSIYLGGNRTWLEAAGLKSSEEVVGKSDYDLPWEKKQTDSFREDDRRVMESGIPEYDIIEPYLRADGTHAWARTNKVPLRDTEGNVVGVLGTYEDITERKRAEEALRGSETRYRRLVEGSPDIVWSFSDKRGTLYASARVEAILGYSPDYLYKNPWLWNKSIHPGDQDHIAQAITDFAAGKDLDVEYRIKDSSGNWRWFHGRSIGRRVEGDETIIEGISTDITERKRAEEELRRSEKQASAAIEAARGFTFSYDIATGKVIWGGAIEEITGYTPEEFAQVDIEGWAERIHPEDRGEILSILQEAIETLDRARAVYRFRKKDGGYVTLASISLTEEENGKPVRLVGILQDITERKRAEEALRWLNEELEHRLAELTTLYQSSLALSHSLNPEELPQMLVEVMESLLGYEYGAILLIDEQTGDLIPFALSDQGKAREFIERDKEYVRSRGARMGVGITGWVAQTGQTVHTGDVRQHPRYLEMRPDIRSELCVPLKVGERITGVINIETPQLDAYTEHDERLLVTLAGQVAVAIENMRLYENLRRAAEELEQRVKERTAELEAFTYSVSHDLRAPLRAMEGFSQALLEDYADRLDPVGQNYAHRIAAAAQHMDTLIQALLAYSRLSRVEIKLRPVVLEGVVQEALSLLTTEIQEKSAQVTVERPLPQVVGHHATLVQVVGNLLSNAIKFVAPGVKPHVRVWAEECAEWVRLWVEDNGIGIAAEHHELIFCIFERLHGVETYPGTGVGLAIVRKGVERLGGCVGVESEPGRGSRFWVELPPARS